MAADEREEYFWETCCGICMRICGGVYPELSNPSLISRFLLLLLLLTKPFQCDRIIPAYQSVKIVKFLCDIENEFPMVFKKKSNDSHKRMVFWIFLRILEWPNQHRIKKRDGHKCCIFSLHYSYCVNRIFITGDIMSISGHYKKIDDQLICSAVRPPRLTLFPRIWYAFNHSARTT